MIRFSSSIHRRIFPIVLLAGGAASAACSTQVDIAASAASTGAGGATSSGIAATSTASASTSSSSSSSGVIGDLHCRPGEGAIVAGTSGTQTAVAVQIEGAWSQVPGAVPGHAFQSVAYVDVYRRLEVLWTEQSGGADHAHFVGTQDGVAFETHDVVAWHPHAAAPIFPVGPSILVGRDDQGTSLAYYDPDAFDWTPWQTTSFLPTAAAAAGSATLLVGVAPSHALCEVTLDATATWGPTHCHAELLVWTGGEIPAAPPHLAALPGGDVVAIYATSYIDLAAAIFHAGVWSTPLPLKLPEQSVSNAVTATADGDVLVGVVSTAGKLDVIRFSPVTGWGTSIAVATDVVIGQELAAAPGICGDDAIFAYASGSVDGTINVARVRGDAAATTTIATLPGDPLSQITLATRQADSL